MEDFQKRCAYSQRHVLHAQGEHAMQVDHYNPTLTGARRHRYRNLYLAVAHCNNKKNEYWPTAAEQRLGVRFLDPCSEKDYGEHIWEDPESHELVATTPAGRYHIDCCDLNAPTFIDERRRRAKMRSLWDEGVVQHLTGGFSAIAEFLGMMKELLDAFIPDIPSPPEDRKQI